MTRAYMSPERAPSCVDCGAVDVPLLGPTRSSLRCVTCAEAFDPDERPHAPQSRRTYHWPRTSGDPRLERTFDMQAMRARVAQLGGAS